MTLSVVAPRSAPNSLRRRNLQVYHKPYTLNLV